MLEIAQYRASCKCQHVQFNQHNSSTMPDSCIWCGATIKLFQAMKQRMSSDQTWPSCEVSCSVGAHISISLTCVMPCEARLQHFIRMSHAMWLPVCTLHRRVLFNVGLDYSIPQGCVMQCGGSCERCSCICLLGFCTSLHRS